MNEIRSVQISQGPVIPLLPPSAKGQMSTPSHTHTIDSQKSPGKLNETVFFVVVLVLSLFLFLN